MTRYFFSLVVLLLFVGASQATNLKPYTGKVTTPPLKLMDLQGNTHDLNDYKGQIVLLQFWATYCPPCRKEMPSMNRMIEKMEGTAFKILAVDMGESKAEVRLFIDEVKPEFTILMDESGKSIADWQVFAAPSNFIIGPEGKIRYTLFGGVEWDSDEMIDTLKALAEKG
ncbi:MAG: TlpA family protein disulfide reductase, partial [Gammaproteobacteria bacterium]|nr:TlpA family protein disulfide reductase [Gammaproteobacteria bacterium]